MVVSIVAFSDDDVGAVISFGVCIRRCFGVKRWCQVLVFGAVLLLCSVMLQGFETFVLSALSRSLLLSWGMWTMARPPHLLCLLSAVRIPAIRMCT